LGGGSGNFSRKRSVRLGTRKGQQLSSEGGKEGKKILILTSAKKKEKIYPGTRREKKEGICTTRSEGGEEKRRRGELPFRLVKERGATWKFSSLKRRKEKKGK